MGISSSGVGKVYIDNIAFMENKGDILTKDTSPELLSVGTPGQLLQVSSADKLEWANPPTAPAIALVETKELDVANWQVDFEDLDLDTDKKYLVIGNMLYSNGSYILDFSICPNKRDRGDFDSQLNKFNNTTLTAARITASNILPAAIKNTVQIMFYCYIQKSITGYINIIGTGAVSTGGVPDNHNTFYISGNHIENMTSLRFESGASGRNFSVGSKISIYKIME